MTVLLKRMLVAEPGREVNKVSGSFLQPHSSRIRKGQKYFIKARLLKKRKAGLMVSPAFVASSGKLLPFRVLLHI